MHQPWLDSPFVWQRIPSLSPSSCNFIRIMRGGWEKDRRENERETMWGNETKDDEKLGEWENWSRKYTTLFRYCLLCTLDFYSLSPSLSAWCSRWEIKVIIVMIVWVFNFPSIKRCHTRKERRETARDDDESLYCLSSHHISLLCYSTSHFLPSLGVWCMPFTRKLHRDDEVSVSNFAVLLSHHESL